MNQVNIFWNHSMRKQARAYPYLIHLYFVNRELEKKTTPEMASHIVSFLAPC